MTRAYIIDQFGTVEETSGRDLFARVFGHAPKTKEQRLKEWQAEIEHFADVIERGGEWSVPPPCLRDARLLVEGRKRARRAA